MEGRLDVPERSWGDLWEVVESLAGGSLVEQGLGCRGNITSDIEGP